jgi:peptide chain release factor 1
MDYLDTELKRVESEIAQNKKLLESEPNPDMQMLIQDEIKALEKQLESLQASLAAIEHTGFQEGSNKNTKDFNGNVLNTNVAILEIRAGTGGDEAGLFAFELYRMYMRHAERAKWKAEEMYLSENGEGGVKTVTTYIKGKDVYNILKNESGVHRVQRVPTTESAGRIHTSTVTVAILPEVAKTTIEIRPEDVRMDFFRAGGHGGQNVNKVSTAVRLTHIPTNVVVECQEERSQLKNREKAMKVLESRLYTIMQEQHVKNLTDIRASQVGTGERNEKIRTYNFPQDRITDHRINVSWHNMLARMNGEIEDTLTECSKIEA